MKQAPLFVDAKRLCAWLLQNFDQCDSVLGRRIAATSLDLLRAVTLALKKRDREEQIERADEELIALRVELRLAEQVGLLDEDQLLYALEEADKIGRQLGGWRRSLGAI